MSVQNEFDQMNADEDDQLFFVTSYSDFDKLGKLSYHTTFTDDTVRLLPLINIPHLLRFLLAFVILIVPLIRFHLHNTAHGPRGTEATDSIYVYQFHPSDGSLVLLNVQGNASVIKNPAFSRHHPRLNVVYTCTEDCHENGKIIAYKLKGDGTLEQFGDPVDAGGTSTCYLTIDKAQRNLLAVNYWNSTLVVIPIDPDTGELSSDGVKNIYDPNQGKTMIAPRKLDGGANHSFNDDDTISARQADPHSHALVLDPFVGRVAYVPDLGKDLVREFYYDAIEGNIAIELNVMPSGLCTGKPDGPRYFEFHPQYNIAYVVNELSSTVSRPTVLSFDICLHLIIDTNSEPCLSFFILSSFNIVLYYRLLYSKLTGNY